MGDENKTIEPMKSLTSPLNGQDMPIVFISDLHFDFTKGKYEPGAALNMRDDFVSFIIENYSDCLLCLAGDYFNDYRKTLAFINELESKKVTGFCVLGNHDFWNGGKHTYSDIIKLFDTETKNNEYFRLLMTGRKYYFNDICVIGDTGWTSFMREKGRTVSLEQFMKLPDAKHIKGFDPKKIITLHNKWISFANKTLLKEEKVLVVTHFPMVDFTKKDMDCWWSSLTKLKGDNSWRIYGHTHNVSPQHDKNNVSSQRGYNNKNDKEMIIETSDGRIRNIQYSSSSFGRLIKVFEQYALAGLQTQILNKYYSPLIVSKPKTDIELSSIKRRGYRRCMANRDNFAALVNNPDEYLGQVNKEINRFLKRSDATYMKKVTYCDTYIGYRLEKIISKHVIESIFESIKILENKSTTDVREFITAAVITGYVYNGMPYLIEEMRPLDDYDIIRFWLMFLTMKQYGIGMDYIYSVKGNGRKPIPFHGVDIYLPVVNGLSLSIEEVQQLLQSSPMLLDHTPVLQKKAPS